MTSMSLGKGLKIILLFHGTYRDIEIGYSGLHG